MLKTTKTKIFDTATATVVKKVTYGSYGDPAGYEKTMFITPEGNYFLFTNGGSASEFKAEKIRSFTKKKAEQWLEEN